ncbi:hypothetical protein JXA56_04535 [Candidatus Micrarchaeota archaeon]|nr:hypothetical protein [Candidatus Micrarchaeota archaeon]
MVQKMKLPARAADVISIAPLTEKISASLTSYLQCGIETSREGICGIYSIRFQPGMDENVLFLFCKGYIEEKNINSSIPDLDIETRFDLFLAAEKKGIIALVKLNDHGESRFKTFLARGFYTMNGNRYDVHKIELLDETTPDDLYKFCRRFLGYRNFPTLMPEIDGQLALEMFRKAEEARLIKVVKK